MLWWFLNHFHIFIMSAWRISITDSTWQMKDKYIYSFSHSCCINFLVIHVLRHDCKYQMPPILHLEQPSAENFPYFSGQNAQCNFLQWKGPLESSNSTSRKRRDMVCFDSGRENRMYACAGSGGKGKMSILISPFPIY